MKLLMIYCSRFAYRPAVKVLEDFSDVEEGRGFDNILVAFIQAEEHDENDASGTEKKLLKNLKWAAGKNETRRILLHSFAHLSESKASPEFTKELFNRVESRLINVEYDVDQTPFGYFLDLDIQAPGYSQARMFKSF